MAQCKAVSSRTGAQCRRSAIAGGTVCPSHGGRAPQVRAAAQRRLALGRAMGEAGQLLAEVGGVQVESADPLRTLTVAVAVSAAMVEVFTDLVAGLDLTGSSAAMVGPDHLGDLGVHPYVELLGTWTERAARVSKAALDAGVSERQLRLAERDVRVLAASYRAFVVGFVDELVAAGVDRKLVDQVVASKAPALMRRALEQANVTEET